MLKILVVSDSHGDVSILNDLFLSHQDFDYFFHLGDSELLSYQLYPFISVRGNNDYFDYPISKLIHTKYGDFYLEHGNHHIDDEYIRSKNARFFLYGHTHRRLFYTIDDNIFVINPGSVTLPRDNNKGTYLEIILSDFAKPIIDFKEI